MATGDDYLNTNIALTVREMLTSGCHVHVSVADDEEGVAVLDRVGQAARFVDRYYEKGTD